MNDLIKFEIDSSIDSYIDANTRINNALYKLEVECELLIKNISHTSFDESIILFDELHSIQRYISRLKYTYEFPFSNKWLNFEYFLDRDDLPSREFWYKKFKHGLKWPDE